MRVLDLFSGIGGFSLGLERTGGFRTVAFCEIEDYPRRVLAKHWPGVPIYEDVRKLTAERLAADGIGVDVITGGFPCQDISVAGKQAGIEAERSGLWSECTRLLGELRPDYAIFENVTALLSGDNGKWFQRVLWDISQVGYDAEWHCIPASELGANHHRDRVWIIANSGCKLREKRDTGNIRANKKKWPQSAIYDKSSSEGYVADTKSQRIQGNILKTLPKESAFPWCENIRGIEDYRNRPDLPQPVICRTDDGIRSRLHGLGNAVVPQIPELIGRAILEFESAKGGAAAQENPAGRVSGG